MLYTPPLFKQDASLVIVCPVEYQETSNKTPNRQLHAFCETGKGIPKTACTKLHELPVCPLFSRQRRKPPMGVREKVARQVHRREPAYPNTRILMTTQDKNKLLAQTNNRKMMASMHGLPHQYSHREVLLVWHKAAPLTEAKIQPPLRLCNKLNNPAKWVLSPRHHGAVSGCSIMYKDCFLARFSQGFIPFA